MTLFDRVKGFKEQFPEMVKLYKDGVVMCWDDTGAPQPLTEEHTERIERLETELADSRIKVYAVLDNVFIMGDEEVHMTSYLYTNNSHWDISQYNDSIYYAMSLVINKHWGIEEMGSVLITGSLYGGPRRVG